ncbi:dolichyl-phosphate-mannose--protein mannosyltransferase [Actinocorallia longicatena]|uniref:Polyprenol-phosphate-mannose--protein mannosyltransferase n=1 Tax=Actinocorallia longicatena TaxID=111803 RepID=A0ABP6QA75_9ACTN
MIVIEKVTAARPADWTRRRLSELDWGWLGPVLVSAIAFLLVFPKLGRPHELMWDETYYAKDAWAMLYSGTELSWRDQPGGQPANGLVMGGDPAAGLVPGVAGSAVHPPMGKWMIAIGIRLFGMNPLGWRAAAAVAAVVAVLVLARTVRRMTGSTLFGCAAGLLLAMDGSWLVMGRVAMLDMFLMTFIVCAFGCLVVDRDRTRERLSGGTCGPFLLHGWRILAAVFFGLAACTKWTGLFALAFLWALALLWDRNARKAAGVRRPWAGMLLKDALPSVVTVGFVALTTYVAGWWGFFVSGTGLQEKLFGRRIAAWDRDWADGHPSALPDFLDPLRSLWQRHVDTYSFHHGVIGSHPSQSWPWEWTYQGRPAGMHFSVTEAGQRGCGLAEKCVRNVTDLGTPAIWWVSLPVLGLLLLTLPWTRDWRAAAAITGYLAGILPWLPEAFHGRTMFSTYALPMLPFIVIGLVVAFAMLWERTANRPRLRTAAGAAGFLYLLAVSVTFAYFYPILTAELVPWSSWMDRMWLHRWI